MLSRVVRPLSRAATFVRPRPAFSALPHALFSSQANQGCSFRVADEHRTQAPIVKAQANLDTRVKGFGADLGGSTADRGCISPAVSFSKAFQVKCNVRISMQQARGPMGIAKRAHIRELYAELFNKQPSTGEVESIHSEFLRQQLGGGLKEHSKPFPHLITMFNDFNALKIEYGFHSAYSRAEVDVIKEEINKLRFEHGLSPIENFISNDDVAKGRPFPSMMHRVADKMGLQFAHEGMGLDDSEKGIEALIAGGYWAVGMTDGNLLDIDSLEQLKRMSDVELATRRAHARKILEATGAHYVISDLRDLRAVALDINLRLQRGERPISVQKQAAVPSAEFRSIPW